MNAPLLLTDRPAQVFSLAKGAEIARALQEGCPEWLFAPKCVSPTGTVPEMAKVIIEVFDEENELVGTW